MSRAPESSFWREAALGFGASVAAAALVAALAPVVGQAAAIRALIPVLGLVYVIHVLATSRERTGRIVVAVAWISAALATWLLVPGVAGTLRAPDGLAWLVRSLYRYSSLFSALTDLGLAAVATAIGVWVHGFSGSLFLAGWCFFLAQALHVAIPQALGRPRPATAAAGDRAGDAFASAYRQAQAALRRSSAVR
jgi:hypothetical protein